MESRDRLTVNVAGLTRELPLFEVAPGVRIAIFNMLGDTGIVKAAAEELVSRLDGSESDVLLTAEAKSIPLAYEMSVLLGIPYVVLRKSYKPYMGETLEVETLSITTGKKQTLYLDEKDRQLIRDQDVVIVDDVISTGSTLKGMTRIVEQAEGRVSAVTAVFTEGDQDWSNVIALGNLPIVIS